MIDTATLTSKAYWALWPIGESFLECANTFGDLAKYVCVEPRRGEAAVNALPHSKLRDLTIINLSESEMLEVCYRKTWDSHFENCGSVPREMITFSHIDPIGPEPSLLWKAVKSVGSGIVQLGLAGGAVLCFTAAVKPTMELYQRYNRSILPHYSRSGQLQKQDFARATQSVTRVAAGAFLLYHALTF